MYDPNLKYLPINIGGGPIVCYGPNFVTYAMFKIFV